MNIQITGPKHLPSQICCAIFFILNALPQYASLPNEKKNGFDISYCEYLCHIEKCKLIPEDDNLYLTEFKRLQSQGIRKKRDATISPTVNKLVVSAGKNQTIQLPIDQVVLSSFVVPSSNSNQSSDYKYNWELISPLNKEDIGNIEGLNNNQVKLSHLKAGNYTFRVTVNGESNESGSATVNLTVLPPKTENKPPVVIIEPKNTTVQLPNKDTVLDGSSSYDDDQITKYEWHAVQVPIGYKNSLSNSSILRLKDLTPGLYVFNLTVTDSKNSTNSTTATINVLKEIDYPPTANAGQDIVLYLPQNEVILNGNKSTDDKGIASWHWIRADDGPMGVDMDGTSTAYLHLSKLEVGVYKFVLQVTDSSNQISKSETHVFIKPESNEAPKSNAGGDIEVILPAKYPIVLDGSKSTDDIGIIKWYWKQIDGPKMLNLLDDNSSIAKIENLTPGKYNFSLTVWDMKNLTSTSYKLVTVIQDKNIAPKAIAGGDKTVTLPLSEVFLDGSASYDDAEIVLFRWDRLPMSLAYGNIVGNSSNCSILRLNNLVSGRYLFQLTVTDAHGASSSDVASLIVKSPANILDQIEMVLNYDIQSFTFDQQTNIYKRLQILLSDEHDLIKINSIEVDKTRERRTILIFSAFDSNNIVLNSVEAVRKIKSTLKSDPSFLPVQVISLETLVCQNNCSAHGTCDQYSKRCMCEAFWMENFIRFYFGDNESNCEWSVLYVIIICFTLLISMTIFLWMCICFISRYQHRHSSLSSNGKRKFKRTNRFRYMLIDQCDNVEMVANNYHRKPNSFNSHSNLSDSDQSSETIFNHVNDYRSEFKDRKNKSSPIA